MESPAREPVSAGRVPTRTLFFSVLRKWGGLPTTTCRKCLFVSTWLFLQLRSPTPGSTLASILTYITAGLLPQCTNWGRRGHQGLRVNQSRGQCQAVSRGSLGFHSAPFSQKSALRLAVCNYFLWGSGSIGRFNLN